MINKTLITFIRPSNLEPKADFSEKVGNLGCGLLRIGFGKTIIVKKMPDGKITFTEKVYSTGTRVTAVALFILMLPITVFLSGIGYIGMMCSKSHRQIFNLYVQNTQSVANQIDDNIHQQNAILVTSSNTLEDRAATIIQKHFRGYLARKSHLPSRLPPPLPVIQP